MQKKTETGTTDQKAKLPWVAPKLNSEQISNTQANVGPGGDGVGSAS